MLFDALLYKKHPALYRCKIAAAPPLHYYAIVVAALVSIACVLAAIGFDGGWAESVAAFGATAAGALWAGLTVQFIAYRLRRTSRAPRHVAEMIVTSIVIPLAAVFWRLAGAIRYRVLFV
jgi:hypothetical protein